MENINKTISIAYDLFDRHIIDDLYFPLDIEALNDLKNTLQPDFDNYLSESIERNDKKYFQLDNINKRINKTLVIEIGGTKTTVQRFNVDTVNSINISPLSEIKYLTTIKQIDTDKEITSQEFFDWIAKIIKEHLDDCENIGMNIATPVNSNGIISRTPANIPVENIKGVNIIKELQSRIGEISIKIFNDAESVAAIQLLNKDIKTESFFIDISGTGNNSSIYSSQNYIQSLESGHILCIKTPEGKKDLEYAVGGKLGLERGFNEIIKNNNLSGDIFTAYQIDDLIKDPSTKEILKDIAKLTYERLYLYKALSYIFINKFFKDINLVNNPQFIMFGGINKLVETQKGVNNYLNFYKSNIKTSYTFYGEDAGRYGAALIANIL